MDDASFTDPAPSTLSPFGRFGCAGTEPSTEAPCDTPVTAEIDGLLLCGRHAAEFGAEARSDVLEVAALYLSRWLRVAREELCNDELVRRLQAVREGIEEEAVLTLEALGQTTGRLTSAGGAPPRPRRPMMPRDPDGPDPERTRSS